MRGDIIPLPQYASMAWCSVKGEHRDNFIFTASILRDVDVEVRNKQNVSK